MTYQPIDHYGAIGDLHTVALVGIDGSIHDLEGSTRNQAALGVTQAGIKASTTCVLE